MHQTHDDRLPTLSFRALLVAAAFTFIAGIVPTPTSAAVRPEPHRAAELDAVIAQPHVLEGDIANVIVEVRGGEVCSGTPITASRFVVTAAHCVLDRDGHVTPVTVRRDGTDDTAVAVLVDTRYHDTPTPEFDGAVLIMDEVVPGPSAALGQRMPTQGLLTLVGFQPLDTDGTLLRGTNPHNRPRPTRVTGAHVKIDTAAAGCVERATSVAIATDRLTIRCGLIPGASGGGLFEERGGELILIGVTSTVADDLSSNGLVPVAYVRRLLDDPLGYVHPLTTITSGTFNSRSTILNGAQIGGTARRG